MDCDVYLEECFKWQLSIRTPLNSEFEVVGFSLKQNIERMYYAAIILPWMVGKATLYQDAATKVNLKASPEEKRHKDFTRLSQSKIHALADKDEARALKDKNHGFKRDKEAFNTIKFLLAHYGQPDPENGGNKLLAGFDALFESILINTWTAIEILIEDLWSTSRAILADRHVDDRSEESRIIDIVQSVRSSPKIPRKDVKRWSGKAKNFRTLMAARVAYGCWFSKDASDIDNAIADLDLDALALLRNLIVHKACKPDSKYFDQSKGIPGLEKLAMCQNGKISFTGVEVGQLINSNISIASMLFEAVDQWIYRRR